MHFGPVPTVLAARQARRRPPKPTPSSKGGILPKTADISAQICNICWKTSPFAPPGDARVAGPTREVSRFSKALAQNVLILPKIHCKLLKNRRCCWERYFHLRDERNGSSCFVTIVAWPGSRG